MQPVHHPYNWIMTSVEALNHADFSDKPWSRKLINVPWRASAIIYFQWLNCAIFGLWLHDVLTCSLFFSLIGDKDTQSQLEKRFQTWLVSLALWSLYCLTVDTKMRKRTGRFSLAFHMAFPSYTQMCKQTLWSWLSMEIISRQATEMLVTTECWLDATHLSCWIKLSCLLYCLGRHQMSYSVAPL